MNAEEAPPEHIAELPPELIPVSAMGATDAPPSLADVEPPAEADTSPDAAPAVVSAATGTVAASQGPSRAETEPKADAPQAGGDGAATETASALNEPAADPLAEPVEAPPPAEEVAAATEPSGTAAEPDARATESASVSASAEAAAEPVAETAIQTDQVPGVAVEAVDEMGELAVVPAPEGVSEEAEEAEQAEHAEAAAETTEGHEEGTREPYGPGLKGPGGDGAEGAVVVVPAWRQRRKAHPIRNLIGLVVSGLLGLAMAYGLLNWLAPDKLKFWNRARPQAAEGEDSNSAAKSSRPGSESVLPPKLPEPGAEDEFSGLENRTFEAPKNVQPSRPTKTRK